MMKEFNCFGPWELWEEEEKPEARDAAAACELVGQLVIKSVQIHSEFPNHL